MDQGSAAQRIEVSSQLGWTHRTAKRSLDAIYVTYSFVFFSHGLDRALKLGHYPRLNTLDEATICGIINPSSRDYHRQRKWHTGKILQGKASAKRATRRNVTQIRFLSIRRTLIAMLNE